MCRVGGLCVARHRQGCLDTVVSIAAVRSSNRCITGRGCVKGSSCDAKREDRGCKKFIAHIRNTNHFNLHDLFDTLAVAQNVLVANRLAAFFASILSSSGSSATPFRLDAPVPALVRPPSSPSTPSSSFTLGGKPPLTLRSSASGLLGTPLHASPLGPWLDAILVLRVTGCASRPSRDKPPEASIARTSGRTASRVAKVRRSKSISRRTYSRMLTRRSAAVRANHRRFSCNRLLVTRCVLCVRYCSWLLASSRALIASSTFSRRTELLALILSAADNLLRVAA